MAKRDKNGRFIKRSEADKILNAQKAEEQKKVEDKNPAIDQTPLCDDDDLLFEEQIDDVEANAMMKACVIATTIVGVLIALTFLAVKYL